MNLQEKYEFPLDYHIHITSVKHFIKHQMVVFALVMYFQPSDTPMK